MASSQTSSPLKKAYVTLAIIILFLGVFFSFMLIGYGRLKDAQRKAPKSGGSEKLQLVVAVDPCAYLARRVGGDYVQVEVLTPAGKSPETFAPTPARLKAVAQAKLLFITGTPVEERFMDGLPQLATNAKIVDLRDGVALLENPHDHSRHDGEESTADDPRHHDESMDPHLWTSPDVARKMTSQIVDALVEIDPDNAESYQANGAKLDAELAQLQRETADALAPYEGRYFYVFHPAYGYYAREFHLQQRAVEVDGKSPRPRELNELVESAKAGGIRALIVQPEFNRTAAQVVADKVGADLIDHSPLQGDYFDNIRTLTAAILQSFGDSRTTR